MRFQELNDEQWGFIKPLLPPSARTGRRRADDRRTINAILYVLTTGCRWMDLPEKYGPKSTAHDRLREWGRAGVWERMMKTIVERGYSSGMVKVETVIVDSTDVAAKKGGRSLGMMGTRGSRVQRFMLQSHRMPSL